MYRQFRCTGLLRSSKLGHLDGKILACFTRNLVQILMNLVFSSKGNKSGQKMVQTKVVLKNANWVRSEAKGYLG